MVTDLFYKLYCWTRVTIYMLFGFIAVSIIIMLIIIMFIVVT